MVTYLNSAAALARAGVGGGGFSEPGQLVTLFETSARDIESCVEIKSADCKVGRLMRRKNDKCNIELRDAHTAIEGCTYSTYSTYI